MEKMADYESRLKGTLLEKEPMRRTLSRIAHEIVEKNESLANVALIGIKTRGEFLAERIKESILSFEGVEVLFDTLDISDYRDDLTSEIAPNKPIFHFNVAEKDIILIDDVLFTGRTARAAMEAVIKSGRPRSIQLAVMVDRGHRELPIRADYVGKNIPTSHTEEIKVLLEETDGEDKILLLKK